MTITNTSLALGSWSVKLAPGTPLDVLGKLGYLGHIAISVGRPDPRVSGDSLLTSARYVGPLRKLTFADDGFALAGTGMAVWLGDENDKGPVILDQLLFTDADFVNVVTQLVNEQPSVKLGRLSNVANGYTGFHQYVTVRKALDFVCSTMTSDTLNPVEWRVNGDGSVDAGFASDLYQYEPITIIARRGGGGDMNVRALPGTASTDEDVEDYATEVILLGQGEGLGIASAQAKLDPALIPYKDLFGHTVRIARTVSQSSTDAANSLQQAQIALAQYADPRDAVTLSTAQFDIEGDVKVGDSVWVFDPTAGLVDTTPQAPEIIFRGERINPVRLRVSELTWPVEQGMSVAFRTPAGEWVDLTDYVIWETGDTRVTVGGYDRSLTNPTGRQEALGTRAAPNTSVPETPVFLTSQFVQAVYQSTQFGITKAQIQLRWLTPTNTDGTSVIDGDHYEIRFRTSDGPGTRVAQDSGTPEPIFPDGDVFPGSSLYPGDTLVGGSAAVIPPGFPSTWAQVAGITWSQMGSWAQPVEYVAGPWHTAYAAFDTNQLLIQELTPGVPYQFEIRAVDNAVPPNYSDFSAPVEVVMNGDSIPPPTPAPASVASSLIAIEVTHTLGAASGGTFNLPADMHHFEVHTAYEPTFTCSPATLLGKVIANNGMILSQTPVIATLNVQTTANLYVKVIAVDEAGNRSNPSVAVQSTATLIDNEHISDLEVSKITAGSISADWILAASIQTRPDGARAGMDANGLFAVNTFNRRSWEVQDGTGDMIAYSSTGLPTLRIEADTGNVYLYKPDGLTPTLQLIASAGLLEMHGKLISGDGVGLGQTVVVDPSGPDGSELGFYPDGSGARTRVRAYIGEQINHALGPTTELESIDPTGAATGGFIQVSPQGVWTGVQVGSVRTTTAGGFSQVFGNGANFGYNTGAALSRLNFGAAGDTSLLCAAGSSITMGTDGSVLIFASPSNFVTVSPTGSSLVNNGTAKTFVIDHPTDPQRWLVHGCTESPSAGVEYTGEAVTVDGLAEVELPDYFEALTEDEGRTVQLTPIDELCMVAAGTIVDGRFTVRCSGPSGTRVAWHVRATRRGAEFDAEPKRGDVIAHGDGPYRYLTSRVAPRLKDAA